MTAGGRRTQLSRSGHAVQALFQTLDGHGQISRPEKFVPADG